MKIIDHRLYHDDKTPYPYRESPNHGGVIQPEYLVMHYTASPNFDQAVDWLANRASRASAHVVIGRDGSITQLVPFNVKAWHAGRSSWNGINWLNGHSIGVELDNAGVLQRSAGRWVAWFGNTYPDEQVLEAAHKHEPGVVRGWQLYTPEQLYAALDLTAALVAEYRLRDIVGHDDIAPRRKSDPGPGFPMEAFRSRLFGREDLPEQETLYYTTAVLNIRSGPGSHYGVLPSGPLPQGTRLEVVEEEGVWRQVNVLDNVNGYVDLEGWVYGRYIRPSS